VENIQIIRLKLFGLFFHLTHMRYTGIPVMIIKQPMPANNNCPDNYTRWLTYTSNMQQQECQK